MGKERKNTKLLFKTNVASIDKEYVFKALFQDDVRTAAAMELVRRAAKKDSDPDALYEQDYKTILTELNISKYQYFFLIRKLKQAGILYKNKGRYRVSREFPRCLSKMASRLNEFYDDLSVKLE